MNMSIEQWLDEAAAPGSIWYLKRLSANDTQHSGGHQAGPYIPRDVMFRLFPVINHPDEKNPDCKFSLTVEGAWTPHTVRARAVWYNNKLHDNAEGGRNEVRITQLGGASSPLLDVENTGALAIFAFRETGIGTPRRCRVRICDAGEDDVVENLWGVVNPGQWRLIDFDSSIEIPRSDLSCWLQPEDIPKSWLENYPSGEEVVSKAVEMWPSAEAGVDKRLIERRQCEYEIFQSLEEAVELPVVRRGFQDLQSFIQRANTILQRRKSRSGRSLELHVKTILEEEALEDGKHFSYQAMSESGKLPDFLFPSAEAYGDPEFPSGRLRMLAVKTTCRDRWRQVLDEAERIPVKHLFTLQEGVSPNQYRQMKDAGIRLVVPASVHRAYGRDLQNEILSLGDFIEEVGTL